MIFRRIKASLFYLFCLLAIFISLGTLGFLLINILGSGATSLNWQFFTSYPSRFPEQAGIKTAIYGTIWLMVLTASFSLPLGVATAIYLEEYASENFFTGFIKINISNLAGVPSIVYGILGLTFFVRGLAFGRSVLSGSLTMALLIMPIIIVATQEALRAVPKSLREASYAMGASRWQTVRQVVLPSAFSSVLTGAILALSRAIGEAAPLIMIGALTFVAFVPDSPFSPFTVLPIQIFNWVSRPQKGFHLKAAAAIIVLLMVVFVLNAIATFLRHRYQKKVL